MKFLVRGFIVGLVVTFILHTLLHGQTVGVPVPVRGDTLVSGSAKVTWPTTYTRSRAKTTVCAQVEVGGQVSKEVCRTKTGPWITRVATPPPPPPPPPVATLSSVTLAPDTVTMLGGAQQQFSVTGLFSDGTSKPLVAAWNAAGGTISPGGLYTAGATSGAFRVIGRDAGTGKADTSRVTILVLPGPPGLPQFETAPDPPGSPVFRDTTLASGQRAVRVSWSAVERAGSYDFTAGLSSGGAWTAASRVPSTFVVLTPPRGVSIWFCVWSRTAPKEGFPDGVQSETNRCGAFTVPA